MAKKILDLTLTDALLEHQIEVANPDTPLDDIRVSIQGIRDLFDTYFERKSGSYLQSEHTISIEDYTTYLLAIINPATIQYVFDGQIGELNAAPLILAAKPAQFARFDLIKLVKDEFNVVSLVVITGEVAENPVQPVLGENELEIGVIYIPAVGDVTTTLAGEKVVYFGQHGNDSNTGLSIAQAKRNLWKKTGGDAMQVMAQKNINVAICFDSGTYEIGDTFNFVNLVIYAPFATFYCNSGSTAILSNNATIICKSIGTAVTVGTPTARTGIILDVKYIAQLTISNSQVFFPTDTEILGGGLTIAGTSNIKCRNIYAPPVNLSIAATSTIQGIINSVHYSEAVKLQRSEYSLNPTVLAHQAGRVKYNSTKKCIELETEVAGVVVQLSQEMPFYFKSAETSIVSGDIVYIFSATSGVILVKKYIANGSIIGEPSLFMYTGDVELVLNAFSYFTLIGEVNSLNTSILTGVEGSTIYASASTAGKWQSEKPATPNKIISIGTLSNKHATQGSLFFHAGYLQSEFITAFHVGTFFSGTAAINVQTTDINKISQEIRALSSQVAALLKLTDSSGNLLFQILPSGQITTKLAPASPAMVEVSSAGVLSADKVLFAGRLTDSATITLLETESNWNNGEYTGTSITNTFEGMFHKSANYYFFCYQDNIWIRTFKAVSKVRLHYDSITNERGFQVRMINQTGATSVKGNTVCPSPTVDNAVQLVQTAESGLDAIGVIYEAGIAVGSEMWVWMNGSICEMLFVDGSAPTREYVAIGSDTVNGRCVAIAVPTSTPGASEHWREQGHIMQTKTAGTNVLALVATHYN